MIGSQELIVTNPWNRKSRLYFNSLCLQIHAFFFIKKMFVTSKCGLAIYSDFFVVAKIVVFTSFKELRFTMCMYLSYKKVEQLITIKPV